MSLGQGPQRQFSIYASTSLQLTHADSPGAVIWPTSWQLRHSKVTSFARQQARLCFSVCFRSSFTHSILCILCIQGMPYLSILCMLCIQYKYKYRVYSAYMERYCRHRLCELMMILRKTWLRLGPSCQSRMVEKGPLRTL